MRIYGNQKVQNILNQAAENKNFGHAYLLQGPSGIGKREMAKEFARKLLGEPVFPDFHPDLFILDGKGEILEVAGIENVRQMRDKIILSCQKSKVKAVLGLDIDYMKKESLNAFLKSLEEPLPDVIFALTASSETLKTIESRSVILRCALLSAAELAEMAAESGRLLANIEEIISASMGKPGMLARLLNSSENKFISLSEIIDADIAERFNFAEKICKELDKISIILYNWIGEGRKMLARTSDKKSLFNSYKILAELVGAFEAVKQPGANAKLILENLFLMLNN